MNLREVLNTIPIETLLQDGGTTASVEYWQGAYDGDALDREAAYRYDTAGKVVIEFFDDNGHRISPPELVEA